jgi:SAM-dependent methyltransferase
VTESDDLQGSARVAGDSTLQSQTLEEVASAINYHEWVTSLALEYLGDDPIELGSGLGDYAQRWIEGGVPKFTATELDADRLSHLRVRFGDEPRVHVVSMDVLAPTPAHYSSLVAFNVLEHIENDVQALAGARTMLRPGGYVVIFVPAFQFAMSRFDRMVGHFRRYTVKSLSAVFEAAGLDVVKVHYVNMPGLPAWFVGMRLLRLTPGEGRMLDIWDGQVIPRARAWESRHRVPFGQSVLGIARVPAE